MRNLNQEIKFYEAYKKFEAASACVREAECFKATYSDFFAPIVRGDLLAGRVNYPLVGYSPENTTGGIILYCKNSKVLDIDPVKGAELVDFFKDKVFLHDDHQTKTNGTMPRALPDDVYNATVNSIAEMSGRVAGSCIDYNKLVKVGFNGLISELKENQKNYPLYDGGSPLSRDFFTSAISMLETMKNVCRMYAAQALEMAEKLGTDISDPEVDLSFVDNLLGQANSIDKKDNLDINKVDKKAKKFTGALYSEGSISVGTHADEYEDDEKWRKELLEMAECLTRIAEDKPKTLRDALQLAWIYAMGAKTANFGRMDIYAGDFYANDTIDEAKALALVQSFWRLTVARRICASETAEFNARVVLGGRDRINTQNADKFALLAMEATRTVVETEPQLTLRIYEGMNPDVYKKALDVIGEGRIYPMLYNDDANIPAIAKAFDVSEELAALYYPYGCGEYTLEHTSIGSPNCSLNVLKTLEITLNNGYDKFTQKQVGLKTGYYSDYKTFDELFHAFTKQIEYFCINLGKRHAIEYQVEAQTLPMLLISVLYDDCIKKGRSIVDRGARFTGSIIETFAIVNTADSLTAIKKAVYEEKLISMSELVAALDANFEGYESIYKLLRNMPKYGNDNLEADEMVNKVANHIADFCRCSAKTLGLDYFLIVNVNNYYNVELAKNTYASAEGRKDFAPFANGNTPTAGNDTNGPTAMLNSLARINIDNHAGYTQNMKFSKSQFTKERPKLDALLGAYWKNGGPQAMITALNKDDLENAMKEPEKYTNLIVRVGGFSARFIELRRDIQLDILNRTLHE